MEDKPKYKIGDEITLKGKIECGHDFSFGLIDFKDQEKKFVVEDILTHEAPNWRYKLTADGYGSLRGFYGSGSIYVYEKNLKGGEEMKETRKMIDKEKIKKETRKHELTDHELTRALNKRIEADYGPNKYAKGNGTLDPRIPGLDLGAIGYPAGVETAADRQRRPTANCAEGNGTSGPRIPGVPEHGFIGLAGLESKQRQKGIPGDFVIDEASAWGDKFVSAGTRSVTLTIQTPDREHFIIEVGCKTLVVHNITEAARELRKLFFDQYSVFFEKHTEEKK